MGTSNQKGKNNTKFIIFVVILIILAGLFFINLLKKNSSADCRPSVVKANLSMISTFDYSKVSKIEEQIKMIEDTDAVGNFDVSKKLTKSQYQKIFSSSLVVGDSITEGLSAYGYLKDDQVLCKIGASIKGGDDLFESASKLYPRVVFFSFGMNDMGNYNGHADAFIDKYKKLILKFQKNSPDTKIFVNGISTPADQALKSRPILKNYKTFNSAIKDMCSDLKIKYIDTTHIIDEHPEYYAGDGIHVSPDYYPLWLNNMIYKAGL